MEKFIQMRTFVLLFILAFGACSINPEREPVDYVNPYMGNISHLLVPTYPTIHLPNSLLRVYPNRPDFTGSVLHGFPLVIATHRGQSVFTLNPFRNKDKGVNPVVSQSYDNEKITPYSYYVYLDEEQIDVNFSVSHQSAIYQFNYEKEGNYSISLNAHHGQLIWDGKALSGFQIIENNTKVYVYLEPEIIPQQVSILENGELIDGNQANDNAAFMVLSFGGKERTLTVRYGISFIDAEQARKNMEREIQGKEIGQVAEYGRNTWNDALKKIEVSGGEERDRIVFYTSLYRCYERPISISEDGRYYSPFDDAVHSDSGRLFYTDDWVWDTYQAHHPLRVLIDPEKEEDILHSFIKMAEQSENFWMPTFPRIVGDMRGMDSNHGVATVLDGWVKGLRDFDLEKAYLACKNAVTEKTLAPWSEKPAGKLDAFYRDHGYIPGIKKGEKETNPEVHPTERRQSVTVTLGTSFDEWCLSELASVLGKTEESRYFAERSLSYRQLFNAETGFFHPKDEEGNFLNDIDYVVTGQPEARGFCGENNAWVYSFDVKHNIPDLMELMGGKKLFVARLDQMFAEPIRMSKFHFYRMMPDHTGNVGQYSMGNEPSFHIPYLYNYGDQPWKTQKRISDLLNMWFRNDLMGIPGDEDGGGMSSFVVFSLMGFYPITPGEPLYTIGSPAFEQVKIHLANGNVFEIKANNLAPDNKYIQSATINGEPLNSAWINHEDVMEGAALGFEMGDRANREWGIRGE